MKRLIAGFIVLVTLGVAGLMARQAAERERGYRRLIQQGEEAFSQGQTFVAIEAFSGAIALKGDSMLAYLRRGEAHQERGDAPAALRDLRTAARLDPGATRPLEDLGDVHFRQRRYSRAAESYEAYLRLDDRSAAVFYKLALASRSQGRLDRAVSALQQAVTLNDGFGEAHYLLGLCLREQGQVREARTVLERALRLSPALIPVREELADLHRLEGRAREEIEQLEALAALDPTRAERSIAVGLAYSRMGNSNLAVMALGRAVERFPQNPGVYAALGWIWLKDAEEGGDPAALRKALEALEPVASQSSATGEILGLYGRALLLAGQTQQAEQILHQAAERLPAELSTLSALATAAQRLGHLDEARQALIRYAALVDTDRDEAARAIRIGDLSLQLNDPVAAAGWFQKAEHLGENDVTLLARLADAQAKAGELDAARSTLTRALDQDPSNPVLQSLTRRLQP